MSFYPPYPPPLAVNFLVSTYSQLLQKNMQLLMDSVETLQQDNYRLIGYEKTVAKQTQARMAFVAKRVSSCMH